uniref:Immunoglobulin I-set domain-containing protein n=1 Tax=Megaselia scalaris TaxID=36166 RepID=T1GFH5_MEGSC
MECLKSTTDFAILKGQPTESLSTTEAESMAMAAVVSWYQNSFLLQATDRKTTNYRGNRHELTIRHIQAEDFGNYRKIISMGSFLVFNSEQVTISEINFFLTVTSDEILSK